MFSIVLKVYSAGHAIEPTGGALCRNLHMLILMCSRKPNGVCANWMTCRSCLTGEYRSCGAKMTAHDTSCARLKISDAAWSGALNIYSPEYHISSHSQGVVELETRS